MSGENVDFAGAWECAEAGLFEYLCAQLGHTAGVEAFRLEDLPRGMPRLQAEDVIWCFSISGGPVNVHRQSRTEFPTGVWEMDAEFTARCGSAAKARRLGGEVMQALPVLPDDVPGVLRLYPTSHPDIERRLTPATGRDHAGEEQIVFEMRIPMKAVFAATAQGE